jgi:hypothetical protein
MEPRAVDLTAGDFYRSSIYREELLPLTRQTALRVKNP